MTTLRRWRAKCAGKVLFFVVVRPTIYYIEYIYNNSHRFMESCPPGCGFVLKAPYVTNKMHFHSYPKDVASAMNSIGRACKKMFVSRACFRVPYFILQVINNCHNYI